MAARDNISAERAAGVLRERLPAGWSVERLNRPSAPTEVDFMLEVSSPGHQRGKLRLDLKRRLEPKGVLALSSREAPQRSASWIVVAPYLSEATRKRLRGVGAGYIDFTGNVRVVLSEPGLFIETQGASENPNREERPARTLRGAKAGRIVRALIDRTQPPGVRELAEIAAVDAGYVSRVLTLLDGEALITRTRHGRLASVDWPALIRRWASEAPLDKRGDASWYLQPRGLSTLLADLPKLDREYAVSGSLAAAAFSPIAPARLATIWVSNARNAAAALNLRPAEVGANVQLLEPRDPHVFDGVFERGGVRYVAASQVAADLLASPGRGPSEGEELIEWMLTHESAWRR